MSGAVRNVESWLRHVAGRRGLVGAELFAFLPGPGVLAARPAAAQGAAAGQTGELVDLVFAVLTVATLLVLVAGAVLLLRAGFAIASARGDQEQRRHGIATVRRALVGLVLVGLAHVLLTLSLRHGWGPL